MYKYIYSLDVHRKFFYDPYKIKIKILAKRAMYGTLGSKELIFL